VRLLSVYPVELPHGDVEDEKTGLAGDLRGIIGRVA